MQKPYSFRSGKRYLAATLHVPARRSSRRMPAVLLCHGFTGNRIETRRLFVRLAGQLEKHGVASLRFDYSGCGESSGEFEEFTVQDYIRDAHTALKFLSSRRAVDSTRLGLLGYSLGGCVASYVAGKTAPRVRSIVLWAPVAEPEKTFLQKREEMPFNVEAVETLPYVEYHGWRIGRNFILGLHGLDPVTMLSRAKAPVLLCHGLEDEAVPPQASRLFEGHLREDGITVETLFLEGAGHNFGSVATDQLLFAKTCDWFRNTLG